MGLTYYTHRSVYKLGPSCLSVPMSLFADNRRRLCEALRQGGAVPSGSIVILQGGEQECRHSSDMEIVFRQVCASACVFDNLASHIETSG